MEIALPRDFKEFLKLLNDKNTEYLLIGGYAVGYYGYPRATNDIDVWVGVKPDNALRIMAVLREFGFAASELSTTMFCRKTRLSVWVFRRCGSKS